jgi:glutathione synthase
MGIRYLLFGEPQETFKPGSDTGVVLAHEILRRGHEIDYCDSTLVDAHQDSETYLSKLIVRKILKVRVGEKSPLDLGDVRAESAQGYNVILQRKDPPVNEVYAGHAAHFAKLPKTIVQMNNPEWTPKLSEHLLPQKYPKYAVPTFVCKSEEHFIHQIRSISGKSVAKPKNLYSGIGIMFFDKSTSEEELQAFWEKWKPEVIVQPFIPDIEKTGDLRILVMNRKVVGSVLRKPKPGSLLGNLHQGATPHAFTPTKRQLEAVEVIAEDLFPKGLYLLGLDFIGEYLTEVNITCPTTVPQINQVMGIQGERIIIDELEKLVSSR